MAPGARPSLAPAPLFELRTLAPLPLLPPRPISTSTASTPLAAHMSSLTAAATSASTSNSTTSSSSSSSTGAAPLHNVWQPLPKIEYGFAICPFSLENDILPQADRLLDEGSKAALEAHLINLEVGDEVYVFESLGNEWARGYVVSAASTTATTGPIAAEPQVYVGVFPYANIHVREHLDDAEMRLAEMYAQAQKTLAGAAPNSSTLHTLQEEEDEGGERSPADNAAAVVASSASASRPRSSSSLRSRARPPPPLPSLKCGDETASGAAEPLADEIACALREWSSLLYSYLQRRDYDLFDTVREHIDVLYAARRQLLAQTLGEEELAKLRRDCVARLVKGNVAQGLDVIVRHPTHGGLVTPGDGGRSAGRADEWVSGIRLYALQVALAYVDQQQQQQGEGSFGSSPLEIVDAATAPRPVNKRQTIAPAPGSVSGLSAKYFHLYLDVRSIVANFDSPVELYFSLYNKPEARFLTEEFCVTVTPDRRHDSRRMACLFTDLSSSDMQDLNVVCRIVRSDVGVRATRRPFGCGVLSLGQETGSLAAQGQDSTTTATSSHVMPIFVPVNEAAFSTLHQDIIASRIREFEKSSRADTIHVDVKVLHGDTPSLVREHASLLRDAALTARLGFPDVVFPGDDRNEAYVKLWAGEFFPSTGKIPGASSQKSVEVSIDVRTRDGRVLDDVISRGSGEPRLTKFDSMVFYHQNAPTWGELIKVELPNEALEQCHLFLSFRHRSSKEAADPQPFAHACLPLFDTGRSAHSAFIQDGSHTLVLWRGPARPELYLSLAASGGTANASLSDVIQPLRDTITLRSFLVSTRYTQNDVLLKLLHWDRIEDAEELKSVLTKFTFVGEVEIVKFLRDIFDALFAIVTRGGDDLVCEDLVLNALVTVLGIVQDRRFNNFRATLDVYIDRHFHSQTAHARLMGAMSRLDVAGAAMRASIKVWPYLFKFIVRSRELQKSTGALDDHLQAKFRSDLDSLLRGINRLMSATKPASIVGTQTLALQHFAQILPDLARVYDVDELIGLEAAFADAIFITKGRLVVWKLLHIVHVCQGPLFDHPLSRGHLIPSVVRWVRPHASASVSGSDGESVNATASDAERVTWVESARLATTALAIILDRLQTALRNAATPAEIRQEQDNVDYMLSMMPSLLETYKELRSEETIKAIERHRSPSTVASAVPVVFPSSYPFALIAANAHQDGSDSNDGSSSSAGSGILNCGLGEVATVITMLVTLSPRKHLAGFLEEQLDLEGPEKLSRFLQDFFDVSTSILRNEAWPASWLNVNVLAHQMVLKMADPLAALMVRDFAHAADPPASFDVGLWKGCLTMLLTLLTSEQLVVENFKPQRRRAVWRLAGDIRGEGARIFARLWAALAPEARAQFVPDLVEPVLELCLSHHDELRTCGVDVLATMITEEWHLSSNFSRIEAELIDKLDVLMRLRGDEISRAFFIGQLRARFEGPDVDPKLQEQVFTCLISVNRFLDLLLSVRALPTDPGYEDDRIAGTLKLLGFLRQANRVGAFSSHVLNLVNLHLANHDYIEAALTLKLHADLHTWETDQYVEAIHELCLPRQSVFARRETLYILILDYLGKGQAWEISVDICRELAQQYEYRAVDYLRLAEVMTYQASLFRKIATTERAHPTYFCVAYKGSQWPASLQQKVFVYRGENWEKLAVFRERLQQKHPGAMVVQPGGAGARGEEGQYLEVTALQPEPDRSRDVFNNPDVPPNVRSYYEHNATSLFSFSRPLRQLNDGNNSHNSSTSTNSTSNSNADDVAHRWVEKTYLRCEDAFPTVLRRSEVAEVHVVEISPLENAINDIEAKTAELTTLEKKYSRAKSRGTNTNRLAMALNGAVDAPVNGGIPLYRRAFLSGNDKDGSEEPEVARLRDAIARQAVVISRCIKLHARLCPPEMKPFHETLERFFAENFDPPTDEELGEEDDDNNDEVARTHMDAAGRMTTTSAALAGGSSGGKGARQQGSTISYGLDSSYRLQKRSGLERASSTSMSPLQRHIALLAKQASAAAGGGSSSANAEDATTAAQPNSSTTAVASSAASMATARPSNVGTAGGGGGGGVAGAPLNRQERPSTSSAFTTDGVGSMRDRARSVTSSVGGAASPAAGGGSGTPPAAGGGAGGRLSRLMSVRSRRG